MDPYYGNDGGVTCRSRKRSPPWRTALDSRKLCGLLSPNMGAKHLTSERRDRLKTGLEVHRFEDSDKVPFHLPPPAIHINDNNKPEDKSAVLSEIPEAASMEFKSSILPGSSRPEVTMMSAHCG